VQVTFLILRQMILLFAMMLMGWALVKTKILKADDSHTLSAFSVYLVTPCVIVNSFQISYTQETLHGLLLAFASAVAIHVLLLILLKILSRIFHLDAVEKASVMYSNSGNMIIPVVMSVFGPEWVLYSSAFVSVQIILMWTHGKAVVSGDKDFDLKKIFANLNIISSIIGIIFFAFGVKLPTIVTDLFTSLGALMAPLGMFTIGMLMAKNPLKKSFLSGRNFLIALLRLVVCPVCALLLIKFSGAPSLLPDAPTVLCISFLATTTPPAVTITQLAQIHGQDAAKASSINVVATTFALVTIPLLVMFYWLLIG